MNRFRLLVPRRAWSLASILAFLKKLFALS